MKNNLNTNHSLKQRNCNKKLKLIAIDRYQIDILVDSISKTIVIGKKNKSNKGFSSFYVLNQNGDEIDSLPITEDYILLNKMLVSKNYYISWFVDKSKSKKHFIQLEKSTKDSLLIKDLVTKIKKNQLPMYINIEYSIPMIDNDTLNYALIIEKQNIYKISIEKNDNNLYGLELYSTGDIENQFKDSNLKKISAIPMKGNIFLDNFFAKWKNIGPEDGIRTSDIRGSNSVTSYPYYGGKAFLSVPQFNFHFKVKCNCFEEVPFMNPFYIDDYSFYTESFLNIVFIKSSYYEGFYVLKK